MNRHQIYEMMLIAHSKNVDSGGRGRDNCGAYMHKHLVAMKVAVVCICSIAIITFVIVIVIVLKNAEC